MYRFALRPWWLLSHLLVVALVVLMVNLGFWQLRRLDERRTANALVLERGEAALVPLDELVPADAGTEVGTSLAFRRATATGTYAVEDEVLVRNRTLEQQPGYWVLTPLVTGPDEAVVVNRGWVPLPIGDSGVPLIDAPPPAGVVTVTGLVAASQERGSFGPTDPEGGELEVLSRADVARLDQQVDEALAPVVLQLEAQDPASGAALPTVLPPPTLSEGSHQSYAVQWFIFSTIAVVGYPLVLRRTARNRALGDGSDRIGTPSALEAVPAGHPDAAR